MAGDTTAICAVNQILAKRINFRKQTEYLVSWTGMSEEENTWESVQNLQGVQHMIQEFEMKQKNDSNEKQTSDQ